MTLYKERATNGSLFIWLWEKGLGMATIISDSSPASNVAANPKSAGSRFGMNKAALLLACFLFGLAAACFLIV